MVMVDAIAVFLLGLLLGVALGFLVSRRFLAKTQTARPSGAGRRPAKGEVKMVLLVRTDLGMQKGKIAAQCGHAVLGAYKAAIHQENIYLEPWERSGQMKIALKVSSEEELCDFHTRAEKRDLSCYTVRDAGHTQVAPHSRTVCAIGPASSVALDTLGCNSLKLL
ncbi:unnamed protein product [Symbiodinium necroappetens]|uniref:peptidyl-tRNA hydrolase n=1 Tax=Symbiodinium necroappetens TaxID=1628268 RepID=A0A813ADK6_9DINO|nr:unnamed protein product [Symbiodinium necroappetens]